MTTPHKFAEVIKAWADGLDVEYRYGPLSSWRLYASGFNGTPGFCDSSASGIEWRIKPEPVILKYRRYIQAYTSEHPFVETAIPAGVAPEVLEKSDGFIRWLDTEWQTVEL